MPRLIASGVYSKGDQHAELSQELTGELKTSIQGDHGGVLTPLLVDRDGNLIDYTSWELLEQILLELRKFNMQLSMMTDHEIMDGDVNGNK